MAVEVVGEDVGDEGDVWGPADLRGVFEHEAGEFEDDDVGRADLWQIEEEGAADVAAEEDAGFVWSGQEGGADGFVDERGGGGFSDGAGDADGEGGAALDEEVDFGGGGDSGF